jgi:hypothetical protein
MDAVNKADLVVVSDTGSTDKTVEKLHGRGAIVYEDHISPGRSDDARNRSIDHIPKDADICVSNDLDEIFEPGWREKLKAAGEPSHIRARYLFCLEPQSRRNHRASTFPLLLIIRRGKPAG